MTFGEFRSTHVIKSHAYHYFLGDANVMVFPMNKHYGQNAIKFELDRIRYPASSDIQPHEMKYARKVMLMTGKRCKQGIINPGKSGIFSL